VHVLFVLMLKTFNVAPWFHLSYQIVVRHLH
jgi:hypothetical protein